MQASCGTSDKEHRRMPISQNGIIYFHRIPLDCGFFLMRTANTKLDSKIVPRAFVNNTKNIDASML